METQEKQPRALSEIAREIKKVWTNPYFGAVPYIDAMQCLQKVSDNYGMDSGDSIVRYFLANASTWRGDDAKRIKVELWYLIDPKEAKKLEKRYKLS